MFLYTSYLSRLVFCSDLVVVVVCIIYGYFMQTRQVHIYLAQCRMVIFEDLVIYLQQIAGTLFELIAKWCLVRRQIVSKNITGTRKILPETYALSRILKKEKLYEGSLDMDRPRRMSSLNILFRQITIFIKVRVAFVFELQTFSQIKTKATQTFMNDEIRRKSSLNLVFVYQSIRKSLVCCS